ncbi:MAG: LysE family translocator [Xanthobacteraceae bacterium]
MTEETLLAATSFAFVMAFTPGPNNIMLTASGVNFGFVRSLPHIFGIEVGFVVLLAACGLGLGLLFVTYPAAQAALKIAGVLYMLWLAWKVATAAGPGEAGVVPKPLTFVQAFVFQWINPKAVVACLGAIALFIRPESAGMDFLLLLLVFALATILATITWAGFGAALSKFLHDPRHARVFNITMAVLLVVSIAPMVWGGN